MQLQDRDRVHTIQVVVKLARSSLQCSLWLSKKGQEERSSKDFMLKDVEAERC